MEDVGIAGACRLAAAPSRTALDARGGKARFESRAGSGLAVREEVRVDEAVQEGLAGGIHALELHAHAHSAVAPGDAPLRVDVAGRARETEADADAGVRRERARRADGDPPVPEVERQRGGDRRSEPILHRDADDHTGTAAPVEVVGEE